MIVKAITNPDLFKVLDESTHKTVIDKGCTDSISKDMDIT